MELMVVVIIIMVVTALAIPTLIVGHSEAHVYNDAAQLAELLRAARARALGRETAVAVELTSSNSVTGPDRGTFQMFEAQAQAATPGFLPGGTVGTLFAIGTPITSCAPPTTWPGMSLGNASTANGQFITGVNMNGVIESQAFIYSTLSSWSSSGAQAVNAAWICYTPLGRTYLSVAAVPAFVAGQAMTSVLSVDVNRSSSGSVNSPIGITRTVIIPPSGAARILSH